LMPSILVDSGADMLFYGMGEKSIVEFAQLIQKGIPISKLTTIPQTSFLVDTDEDYATKKNWDEFELSSHEECLKDKKKYARNFMHIEEESNKMEAKKLTQKVGDKKIVVNPPWPTFKESEIDRVYDLPYTRLPH